MSYSNQFMSISCTLDPFLYINKHPDNLSYQNYGLSLTLMPTKGPWQIVIPKLWT